MIWPLASIYCHCKHVPSRVPCRRVHQRRPSGGSSTRGTLSQSTSPHPPGQGPPMSLYDKSPVLQNGTTAPKPPAGFKAPRVSHFDWFFFSSCLTNARQYRSRSEDTYSNKVTVSIKWDTSKERARNRGKKDPQKGYVYREKDFPLFFLSGMHKIASHKSVVYFGDAGADTRILYRLCASCLLNHTAT